MLCISCSPHLKNPENLSFGILSDVVLIIVCKE